MNQQRLYKILLAPVISEKAVGAGDANQVAFKVSRDACKPEIKAAIEKMFNVEVEAVKTLVIKGKRKRTRFGLGKCSDWKKAYVRLAEGHEIDFESGVK
ncbi:MAG: 50S ribosomal protein L23 [Cellvibrionaceae bacterium]|nr:50S ribosomal protein L23 [Cellvibrionaceae bacterium]